MFEKIYTVTLNPSIDYIAEVNNIKINSTNRTINEVCNVGGKGINVASVINNLGGYAKAFGISGGFTGDEIIRQLDKLGVDNDFVRIKENSRINIKLKDNGITEINGKGPFVSDEDIKNLISKMKGGDIAVLSGSVPKGCGNMTYADIAKSLDIPFVIDCTGDMFLNTLKLRPFLVKPNINELEELFDCTINGYEAALKYAEKLNKLGALNVIVSMGEKGAVFTDGKVDYIQKGIKGNVVNTVGAGDSMIAGFLYAVAAGFEKENAFRYASACGTACAFSKGLPVKRDIDNIYSSFKKAL